MSQHQWKISYQNREGQLGNVTIKWPGEPSREQAAIQIREHLLGENFLLVDTPRGHREPTVFLLKSYGFEITKIEESEEK